jgi:hypothetical protein
MDNHQNAVRRPARQDEAILAEVLAVVVFDQRERIVESKNRMLEAHAMLLVVGGSLGAVPLEIIRHDSNGIQ